MKWVAKSHTAFHAAEAPHASALQPWFGLNLGSGYAAIATKQAEVPQAVVEYLMASGNYGPTGNIAGTPVTFLGNGEYVEGAKALEAAEANPALLTGYTGIVQVPYHKGAPNGYRWVRWLLMGGRLLVPPTNGQPVIIASLFPGLGLCKFEAGMVYGPPAEAPAPAPATQEAPPAKGKGKKGKAPVVEAATTEVTA